MTTLSPYDSKSLALEASRMSTVISKLERWGFEQGGTTEVAGYANEQDFGRHVRIDS